MTYLIGLESGGTANESRSKVSSYLKIQMVRLTSFGMRPLPLKDADGNVSEMKRSAIGVLGEIGRLVGCTPHIDKPGDPILLYGEGPLALADTLQKEFSTARDKRGQRLHADTNVLLGIVASYPVPASAILKDQAEWIDYRAWENDVRRYAVERFGTCLRCMVRHVDENNWHVHVLVTPDWAAGQTNLHLAHPAMHAYTTVVPKGTKKGSAHKLRRSAWDKALRQFQDDFYKSVSARHGHARVGPRRGRLSQREMNRERQREWAHAEALAQAAQILREAGLSREEALKERAAAIRSRVELNSLITRLNSEIEKAAAQRREIPDSTKAVLADAMMWQALGPDDGP